ncbi:SurA N-terminal domain-containing protein [Jannaschia sp. M317]|uniref:SurA N-terminal domain-containing protein n=1 Tax=Jannaschia sp. M317 TaxID=2867011 RepID=UPI0021A4FB5B|nr:SurA N-terminal domain-containing protein [Jannaschia sp. M317]UWQ16229.1 SurA N-terminal domain-containing protein [Jannaschia sp. M317]
MAEKKKTKASNVIVWAVLGLLILALGGFGVGQFGGSLSSVASVGDREITVQDYATAIQGEQRRLQQQTGQALTLQQMQVFGLDRAVMERLLATAALEEEAETMGLSVGDAEVAERIRNNPAFGGIAGGFDREGYTFALRNAGLNEARFERQVRDEAARELLQVAVAGGVQVPDTYSATIASWLAETRDATFAIVSVADLDGGALAPSPEEVQAFYDANQALFQTPEIRNITYAWITPTDLADAVEVDEDRILARYEELASEFRQPARVLAERLNFRDQATAEAALTSIAAGETDFDTLVEDRGLTLDDVDQGEIAAADVDEAVASALFALEEPGIAGPVATDLGPALYRVNAILDATETPLEDVRDDILAELARDAATRRIDAARDDIDDLLAGGATLEEIAAETDMILGTIAFSDQSEQPIAGYDAFRAVAATVAEGDFPELESLSDGGLFALRLDGIDPPATPPLARIRAAVEQAWQEDTTARRLSEAADALAARIEAGETFAEAGLTAETVTGIARDGRVEGISADLLSRLFEAEAGRVLAAPGNANRAYVLRLDAVNAADPEAPDTAELLTAIETQLRGDLTSDLFDAYGQAVRADIGFEVDQQAVQAVQSQLLGGH